LVRRYIIRACKDSGVFTDGIFGGSYADVPWCQALLGSERFLAFTVFQTGTNYSEIRATFAPECDSFLGSGTISGVVSPDGRLNLEGSAHEEVELVTMSRSATPATSR
jgi:hypothetical protein